MRVQAGGGVYFVFAAAVFFIYWGCSGSRLLRLTVILLANYLFCAHYGLFYVVLIPACSTLDYLVGLGLMRFDRPVIRRLLVGVSIGVNLGVLAGSRHMGWILNHSGAGASGWDWVFPLGLSFYVFQSLTYTIDLYRRDAAGTSSLVAYLSAASFFPTLQAGPITRVTELIKQFAARPALSAPETCNPATRPGAISAPVLRWRRTLHPILI